jgi:hypothetical protein
MPDEEFAPENAIETLMAEARAGRTPMPTFIRALMTSPVFALPQEGAAEGELAFAAQEGADGALYIPVFTSHGRLARFSGDERAVSVPLGALAESWPAEVSLVVNPGDTVELVLPGHDFRRLAEGGDPSGEYAIPAGATVFVGDPASEPEEALGAVAAALASHPEVAAAYRAQIYLDAPGEEPSLAIGLHVDTPPAEGDDSLQAVVAQAATRAGAPDVSVLVLDVEASGDGIADHMLQRTQPFYERDPSDSG